MIVAVGTVAHQLSEEALQGGLKPKDTSPLKNDGDVCRLTVHPLSEISLSNTVRLPQGIHCAEIHLRRAWA
jgi:hypothetical protein